MMKVRDARKRWRLITTANTEFQFAWRESSTRTVREWFWILLRRFQLCFAVDWNSDDGVLHAWSANEIVPIRVSDLVAGLMAFMDGDDTGPINLGNPGEFTMLELAEKVKEVVNPKAEIAFKENTKDDPSRRKPDISKAMKVLGWEPKIKLEDGLLHMIGDFKTRFGV